MRSTLALPRRLVYTYQGPGIGLIDGKNVGRTDHPLSGRLSDLRGLRGRSSTASEFDDQPSAEIRVVNKPGKISDPASPEIDAPRLHDRFYSEQNFFHGRKY